MKFNVSIDENYTPVVMVKAVKAAGKEFSQIYTPSDVRHMFAGSDDFMRLSDDEQYAFGSGEIVKADAEFFVQKSGFGIDYFCCMARLLIVLECYAVIDISVNMDNRRGKWEYSGICPIINFYTLKRD